MKGTTNAWQNPLKRRKVTVIVERKNELLIVQPHGYRDWNLPGGGIHRNESIRKATVREIKEEINAKGYDLKPLFDYVGKPKKRNGTWTKSHHFVLKGKISGKIVPSSEINKVKWKKRNQKVKLTHSAAHIIQTFYANQKRGEWMTTKKSKPKKKSKKAVKVMTLDDFLIKQSPSMVALFNFVMTKIRSIGNFETSIQDSMVVFRRSNIFAVIKFNNKKLELGFYANKKHSEFKSAKSWKQERITHKVELTTPSDLTTPTMEALRYAYLIAASMKEDL